MFFFFKWELHLLYVVNAELSFFIYESKEKLVPLCLYEPILYKMGEHFHLQSLTYLTSFLLIRPSLHFCFRSSHQTVVSYYFFAENYHFRARLMETFYSTVITHSDGCICSLQNMYLYSWCAAWILQVETRPRTNCRDYSLHCTLITNIYFYSWREILWIRGVADLLEFTWRYNSSKYY